MGFEDRKTWHFFWSIAMFCNFVLCFFFGGGAVVTHLNDFWGLKFLILKMIEGRIPNPKFGLVFLNLMGGSTAKFWHFDPAVLTRISWRSQCSQRKSYLLLLRRFWKMLGIYKCHCCNRLVHTSLQTNTPKTKWALYRLHTVDSTIFTQNHFEYIFCWGGKNRNPSSNPFLKQTKVFPGSTQGWWTQRWGRRKRPCGRGLCALAGTHGAAAFRGTADLTTAFHWNPGRANPRWMRCEG